MLSPQDERDIKRVILDYAHGIDFRDYKLFRACFTDDADCDYSPVGHWKTGDAITAFMDKVHLDFGKTLHRITNIVITENAGGAHVHSYVDALLLQKDGSVAIAVDGNYDDQMVKTPHGWKIKKRVSKNVRVKGALVTDTKN